MKLAVIVVNFNDEKDTLKYVKEITEYEVVDKIVVVDNKSTNPDCFEKLETLRNEKVDVIQSERNGGYSYGNNFGIKYLEDKGLEFDYYAISNPDIEISKEAIKKTIEFLNNNPNVGVAAPKMVNSKDKRIRRSAWKFRTFGRDVVYSSRILELLFYKVLRNGEYSEADYENDTLQVDCISGAFFIIKKNVFHEITGFDENVFLFYEEDILAKRLQEKKYLIYSLNNISFKHYESQTIGKTLSYYKKIKELYISKMYYHNTYTNINLIQIFIFKILRLIRILELIIEIPVRKTSERIKKIWTLFI